MQMKPYVATVHLIKLTPRVEEGRNFCAEVRNMTGAYTVFTFGWKWKPLQTDKNNNLSFNEASEGFEAVMLLHERLVMYAL